MARHSQLLQIIDLIQPQSIVEIGTWNGRNAIAMITQAQKYHPVVSYVGYDLFEEATDDTDAEEFNVKKHCTQDGVFNKIMKFCPQADVNLIKGNTRKTLNPTTADLCFLDGGHSVETISRDYLAIKDSTVVVLDDYYTPDEGDVCPDTYLYGCNTLYDALENAVILPIKDKLKDGGLNQMVMVL